MLINTFRIDLGRFLLNRNKVDRKLHYYPSISFYRNLHYSSVICGRPQITLIPIFWRDFFYLLPPSGLLKLGVKVEFAFDRKLNCCSVICGKSLVEVLVQFAVNFLLIPSKLA